MNKFLKDFCNHAARRWADGAKPTGPTLELNIGDAMKDNPKEFPNPNTKTLGFVGDYRVNCNLSAVPCIARRPGGSSRFNPETQPKEFIFDTMKTWNETVVHDMEFEQCVGLWTIVGLYGESADKQVRVIWLTKPKRFTVPDVVDVRIDIGPKNGRPKLVGLNTDGEDTCYINAWGTSQSMNTFRYYDCTEGELLVVAAPKHAHLDIVI